MVPAAIVSPCRLRSTKPRWRSMSTRSTSKAAVREIIERNHWSHIGETEWKILLASVPGLATSDLKQVEVPVDSPWQGVQQQTLDELESSLRAFSEVYGSRPD